MKHPIVLSVQLHCGYNDRHKIKGLLQGQEASINNWQLVQLNHNKINEMTYSAE